MWFDTTPGATLPILSRERHMDLTKEEIDLLRQWYNAVQDLSPEYLEQKDHDLAAKIYAVLGLKMRAPAPARR